MKAIICVLDNSESMTINTFLIHEFINFKFVPPKEHRVNAAESTIQISRITSLVVDAHQTQISL